MDHVHNHLEELEIENIKSAVGQVCTDLDLAALFNKRRFDANLALSRCIFVCLQHKPVELMELLPTKPHLLWSPGTQAKNVDRFNILLLGSLTPLDHVIFLCQYSK